MSNLFNKLVAKRHSLIVNERNVTGVLRVINRNSKFYVDQNLKVFESSLAKDTRWFIQFNATDDQWAAIFADMQKRGYVMMIKDRPSDIYVKKIEGKSE